MNLPAYSRYKPSRVDWLGDVPDEWSVVPFKHRCHRFALYGANISAEEYVPDGIRFLRTSDIDDRGALAPDGVFIDVHQAREYLLKNGDILLSRSGTLGRAFVFSESEHPPCAYAGYLVRFVPTPRLNPRYLLYFSWSLPFSDWIQTQVIASTIGNVNGQKYAQCSLPLPMRAEQDTIVQFLDRETARLDRLVAKKRELIERLKEKRTALISRTVTRGLPPSAARAAGLPENPPLKPSGIEWLGDIPAHWGVSRLKYCVANIFSGGTPESGNDEYWAWDDDEGIPWVAIADMTRSPVVTNTDRRITRAGLASKRLQILPAGTLLYSMYASLGKVATLRVAATMNQAILGIVPDERRVVQAFLRCWLQHIEAHLEQFSSSNTQDNLNAGKVRAMPLFLPDVPEQRLIADFLDRETVKLDALVAKVKAAIERLQEYRAALITAAVTGKIDVRGEVDP